jgi:hypothetical protein
MARSLSSPSARVKNKVGFAEAIARLQDALGSDARARILDGLSIDGLRKAMRSHTFHAGAEKVELRRAVDSLDARARREGMHVLQGWDFVAHEFPKDIAPVLLLDYCVRIGIPGERERPALAILLDQYFLALLSLLAVRAWDEGDADANLDRVTDALNALHGPDGSGRPFVADAETLLMLAVAYYHPEERGYDVLVDRVSSLDDAHQLRFARSCAALLGGHLRWGLRFMYERDVGRMRDDNAADYPLLAFAMVTLARAYDRAGTEDRRTITESLLDAMSADPWAFTGKVPHALEQRQDWHREVHDWLVRQREALLQELPAYQPSTNAFSPLAFSCNFPSNTTVAMAVLAVHDAIPRLPLNALFSREPAGVADHETLRLAATLMQFAVGDRGRLGTRGTPLIVYDPYDGAHCYNAVMRTLK